MINASDLVEYKIITQYDENEENQRRGHSSFRGISRKRGLCRLTGSLLFIMCLVAICVVALMPVMSSTGSVVRVGVNQATNNSIHQDFWAKYNQTPSEVESSGNNSSGEATFDGVMKRIYSAIVNATHVFPTLTSGSSSTAIGSATNSSERSNSTAQQATLNKLTSTESSNSSVQESTISTLKVIPTSSHSSIRVPIPSSNSMASHTSTTVNSVNAPNTSNVHKSLEVQLIRNPSSVTSSSSFGAQSRIKTTSVANSRNIISKETQVSSISNSIPVIGKNNSSHENLSKSSANTVNKQSTKESINSANGLFTLIHPNKDYYDYTQYHDYGSAEKMDRYLEDFITKRIAWIMCGTVLSMLSIFTCLLLCFLRRRRNSYGLINRSEEMARLQELDKVELLSSTAVY